MVFLKTSDLRATFMKQVKRKLPIISVVQNYNPDSAINDFIAGVTVGLTVIPQVVKENITYIQPNVLQNNLS